MIYLQLALGLVLLVAGGESLVRGAVALAARFGVSPLLIGLTVVGFGTSTPELVTSLQAAFAGSPGIAVGNVVGSNIANILLIFGLSAVMAPFVVSRAAFKRDGSVVLAATVAVVLISLFGDLGRLTGAFLLAGLVGYLVMAYRGERASGAEVPGVEIDAPAQRPVLVSVAIAAFGIALTVFGARLLVDGAIGLATRFGISDAIIGLTIVAIGTSLPELVTSIIAAIRKQGAIAFGNVVGSNIYNILGILGITALVKPIPIPEDIARLDVWIMLVATVALAVVAATGWRATRAEGLALLASYAVYIGWLAMRGTV